MRIKDGSVKTKFHPALTSLLFTLNNCYTDWGGELVITSGSEHETIHSFTSLHYAGCAADIRTWLYADIPSAQGQLAKLVETKNLYCEANDIPINWFDIILESDHIHLEYQPKRRGA